MRHFIYALLNIILILSLNTKIMAAEMFIIDPQHSYVEWHISHFGFSSPSGKWYVNGELALDKDKPENSQVAVKINVADMVTGIPELDKHLRSSQFFDVAKFPTATFISRRVTLTGKMTANVEGILTVHGISRPVVLQMILNKVGTNPITDKLSVGFSGKTKLKRSDFNMMTLIPMLGDEVEIEIEVEAYKN